MRLRNSVFPWFRRELHILVATARLLQIDFSLDVHFVVFSTSSVTPPGNNDWHQSDLPQMEFADGGGSVCRPVLKSPSFFCRTVSSTQHIDFFIIIVCAAEQTPWSCYNMVNTRVLPCLLLARHQPLTASPKKPFHLPQVHSPPVVASTELQLVPPVFFFSFSTPVLSSRWIDKWKHHTSW